MCEEKPQYQFRYQRGEDGYTTPWFDVKDALYIGTPRGVHLITSIEFRVRPECEACPHTLTLFVPSGTVTYRCAMDLAHFDKAHSGTADGVTVAWCDTGEEDAAVTA